MAVSRFWLSLTITSTLLLGACAGGGVAPARVAAPGVVALEPPDPISVAPLATMTVFGAEAGRIIVRDGAGRAYIDVPAQPKLAFDVGGALGTHTVEVRDRSGRVLKSATFKVDAQTKFVEDTGRYTKLYEATVRTMTKTFGRDGVQANRWQGNTYHSFVPWVLDQANTMKGMLLLSPHAKDMVDLYRQTQQPDGMIWSFIARDQGPGYYDSVYGYLNYVSRNGGALFVRQPNENHVEYEYVNMIYQAWKATGDDAWMAAALDSGKRALDYSITSPVRFSRRFGLLKRPLTIDSWDFQVNDAYTVSGSLNPTMTIDPERTKFGVFFGDNTGYVQACTRLAEMFQVAQRPQEAELFRQRARDISSRLNRVSWNGKFFRHFVDEEETVKRDLGVDMETQLAQGNAYSLNRGIAQSQAAEILRTYMALKGNLPPGSPGEWYAIYPPFGKGFGSHNDKWQYMNGGVAGHAAGELARGAFNAGFEAYGVDVLERSLALAEKTDGLIHFAYTGAYEPRDTVASYQQVPLGKAPNMDVTSTTRAGVLPWMEGERDNDLGALPAGPLQIKGVPFSVLNRNETGGRVVVAVARRPGFPSSVDVHVPKASAKAAAVYVLHTAHQGKRQGGAEGGSKADDVAGAIVIKYADGTHAGAYVRRGEEVAGWWFPVLDKPFAGVAWTGTNPKSTSVGLSWAAIANPHPDKEIRAISFEAPVAGSIYAVAALTMATAMPERKAPLVSYGGPDNWAGANMTAALIEGLGGIVDTAGAFRKAQASPRWAATGVKRAEVIVRYPASLGYVAYRYAHAANANELSLLLTGAASEFACRVLLPAGARLRGVTVDGTNAAGREEVIERSRYAVFAAGPGVHHIKVVYQPE